MGPKARAPKAVETMTEYEMEREARLAKNREVLQRLGVPEIVAATRIAGADDGDETTGGPSFWSRMNANARDVHPDSDSE